MYDSQACRRLGLAVLCSAFAAIGNHDDDSTDAEEWLRTSRRACLALLEIGVSQQDGDLSKAIERVKSSPVKMTRWKRDKNG